MGKLLSVINFSTYFEQQDGVILADREINIELDEGEIIGIVGESGSGKSVLAKAIIGYLETNQFTSGEILFYSDKKVYSILELNKRELKEVREKYIFYYPQNSLSVFDPFYHAELEIKSQLEKAVKLKNKNIPYKSAEKILEDVCLNGKIGNDTGFELYSGGQKQLTLLAEILANPPALVILDEPTTAIDRARRSRFIDLVKKIQLKIPSLSFIIISHDIDLIKKIASKIYVMYAGEIVEEGPNLCFDDIPAHPYTFMLINSVPRFLSSFKLLKHDSPFNNKIKNLGHLFNHKNKINQCVFLDRCPMQKSCLNRPKPFFEEDSEHRKWKCYFPFQINQRSYFQGAEYKKLKDGILFQVKNLTVSSTNGDKKILKDINLKIYRSDRVGLVGGSGEGKTTLLKSILNLDETLKINTGANIQFNNHLIDEISINQFRDRIQYVPQVFEDSFLPSTTVFTAVIEALIKKSFRKKEKIKNEKEIFEILKILGLNDLIHRNVNELSGGQKQRVAIARALIALNIFDDSSKNLNKLLFMDEPTSSLDVTLQSNVFYYLDLLQSKFNISYLIVSHDLPLIAGFCYHFYVLKGGRIVDHIFYDQVEELIKNSNSYQFHGYTKELFGVQQ